MTKVNRTVQIQYSPFKPVSSCCYKHGIDIGKNVVAVEDGIYFVHSYNHSCVPVTCEEDGEQWQEWEYLEKDDYDIVITQPQVVEDVRVMAQYRLAELVRQSTGKHITTAWKIHIVDVLPDIEYKSVATPANTSSVSWGGEQISPSVLLKTVDGWTGSRDDTKRELFVLRSKWNALDREN